MSGRYEIEKIVLHFGRYHKYAIGAKLRDKCRDILEKIVEANNAKEKMAQ